MRQVGWLVPIKDKKGRDTGAWYTITRYSGEQLTPRPDGGPRLPDGARALFVKEEA